MEHLIDKSALVAEIERRIADVTDECNKSKRPQFTLYGRIIALENLLSFLDTLEVKEVDLGIELDKYLDNNNMYVSSDGKVKCFNGDSVGSQGDYWRIAKHFFELGLKAQKGE